MSLTSLGKKVRAARGDRSMRDVAREVGLSVSYLCDIENGRRAPSPETITKIARAIGVPDQVPAWEALCGRMPADIERLILASPHRWDELRAMLKRPKNERLK